jgi:hypothetical protein
VEALHCDVEGTRAREPQSANGYKTLTLHFAVVSLGILLLAPSANADAFTFSFTNNEGNIDGTVTGEILGLTNNAAFQAASDLIITSYTGFTSEDDTLLGATPVDMNSWTVEENQFTETSGQITFADFEAINVSPPSPGVEDYISFDGSSGSFGDTFISGEEEAEDDIEYGGPPPITFTPVTAAPEPSSIILLGGGLLLLPSGRLWRSFLSALKRP